MSKRRANGEGNLRKRSDGRWEGRIVVGHKENGDSIFRYLYADTQKELTVKLRQNIDIYQSVDLTERSRMALAEWLEQWLGQMSATLRPSTLEHYQRDMENHVIPYLGKKMLSQVTAADLRKLYDSLKKNGRVKPRPGQDRGLSSATVHGIHTTLHICRTLHREKGGRLVAGDTKTYAGTRKIVLPPSTAELLRTRKKTSFSPWIFHDPLRPEAPVNPSSAYRQLKKLLAQAGLPSIRFHDCRHTFSTHALASGVDAKTLWADS